VRKLPTVAVWLLVLAVGLLVFSTVFTYRWYEGTNQSDRQYSNGQCHRSWPTGEAGCKKNADLGRANAERDLRYALAGFVVAAVAGGGAVLVIRQGDGPEPTVPVTAKPEPSAAGDRLAQLDQLKADGLLSDAEYEAKRQRIIEDL
jgi:hypothetical protein